MLRKTPAFLLLTTTRTSLFSINRTTGGGDYNYDKQQQPEPQQQDFRDDEFSEQQQQQQTHDEQQQQQPQVSDDPSFDIERFGGRLSRERAQEAKLADQFASLQGGWQKGQDERFDLFVDEKRRKSAFEEFDQRVQRAYTRAVRQHRAEVWNGYKRQLKRSGEKLTPTVLQSVNRSINERESWLRDVFTQIDADYRSPDPERQARATTDLRAALDNRAGELIQSHYERKLERRHAGPKQQKLMDAETEDDVDGPNINDDEVNRYAGLRPNMSAIEEAVIERYGKAGREHWETLQAEKDAEYARKLSDAANIYEGLLEQKQAYDEAEANKNVKEYVRRVSTAMVRFRTAMEVEATREELIEAHEAMKQQRKEEFEERRKDRMKIAAEMRGTGIPTEEVNRRLKAQSLDELNNQLTQRVIAEKEEDRSRKRVFMQMLDQLEYETERQEGETVMTKSAETLRERAAQFSAPQIKEIFDETAELATSMKQKHQKSPKQNSSSTTTDDAALTRKALWEVLTRDKWEDPFYIVHSARYQAEQNYDEVYRLTQPTKLRLGKKALRGTSSNLEGGQEAKMLQDPWVETKTHVWGMRMEDMHDVDQDTSKQYFRDHLGWHIRDPNTRDIDWRFERKLGRGLRWTGPTFYKRGVDAKGREEDRPMVEDPNTPRTKI